MSTDPGKAAARRCFDLAMRCDSIPPEVAEAARSYVDEHRLRDPYNRAMTLDGRGVLEAWGYEELRRLDGPDVVLLWDGSNFTFGGAEHGT